MLFENSQMYPEAFTSSGSVGFSLSIAALRKLLELHSLFTLYTSCRTSSLFCESDYDLTAFLQFNVAPQKELRVERNIHMQSWSFPNCM